MLGYGETEGKVAQLATNHFTKTWLNFMNKSPKIHAWQFYKAALRTSIIIVKFIRALQMV